MKKTLKIIGFDLDGTLAGEEFDKLIFNEELPKLYADKTKLPLPKAKQFCYSEYYKAKYVEKISNDQWTNLEYWLKQLGVKVSPEKLLQDLKHEIYIFPETITALKKLKKYKLVIISNAHPNFLSIKLQAEGLKNFFDEIISTPTFHHKKKSAHLFKDLVAHWGINPEEMTYVGNEYEEDYENPKSIGIHAFFLDREKKETGEHVVHDLNEFVEIIKRIK